MSLRAMLIVIDTVTSSDPRVAGYLDPLMHLVGPTADELTKVMREVADDYAEQTLAYLDQHPGGRDRSAATAGMVALEAMVDAANDMRKFRYSVLTHDAEPTTYAASRAAMSVLVWARVTLGHVEACRLVDQALRRPWVS